MHGLTGGSWKRDTDRATAAEKNDPRETGRSPRLRAYRRSSSPRQLPTLHRMSSGSYFPPPVKAVEIPKPHGGGTRTLGVPTIADRVAQTVVARRLEAKVEPIFHPGSYGYRPYRSALDAVAACRQRCWKSDWVIDLDIQKFFDSVDHALMVKAVEAHADVPWVVLYVTRWLSAPLALPDGTLRQRDRGTPQGSAVSPVLANLFMHYAFDMWMAREYPGVAFERYADDAVVHCVTERQARTLVAAIGDRMEQVGLRLHPDKTKVVYCQDGNRRLDYGLTAFTFLGFTFRARAARRSTERCSSRSSRLSARTPRTRSAVRSADGGCTAGSGTTSPRSPDRSTLSCGDGCSTTELSIVPH